jgi:putative ABC transport system permease protein
MTIIQQEITQPIAMKFHFNGPKLPLFLYLAFKEVWRNRSRFFLISLVIALITTLVLFIAGLAEGLGAGNRQYLEKLNADLILYQEKVDLLIPSSRFDRGKLAQVRRVEGVKDVGPVAFSNASIIFDPAKEPLKVALIGVEPGKPGEPPALEGRGLRVKDDKGVIIDRNVVIRTGLKVGDTFTIKANQGSKEELNQLTVAGITDGRQYSIQPVLILGYATWDRVRPKSEAEKSQSNFTYNVIAVQLTNPADQKAMAARLQSQVDKVEAADRQTAYESTPGYGPQQSTLNTQRFFTLLIGILVMGGFFRIQTLQKVAQIGMLKAIGASNFTVIVAFLVQIIFVTALGVLIGSAFTLLLTLGFPPTVPIVFTADAVWLSVVSLLLIGPLGALVSLRLLLKVEPLTALGLAS